MFMDLLAIYDKSDRMTAKELEDEFIIVPINTTKAISSNELYFLNETGRELWQHLNGKTTLEQLIEKISKQYNSATHEQIREDVIALIQDLLRHQIIIQVQ